MDRRRWLRVLLPPGVSVAVHVALLAIVAAVSITAVRLTGRDDPSRDVVVRLESPAPAAERVPVPTASSASIPSASAALAVRPSVSGPGAGTLVAPPVAISIPAPSLPPAGAPAIDMRRAVAPGAAFAGLSATRVRRVVYVVDVSGPMTSSLAFVLDEVRASVSRLQPSQVFQVVLFSQDLADVGHPGTLALPTGQGRAGLVPATPQSRAALADFLDDVRPGGRSNPLAGLRRALAWKPDVIFLLARGIARTGPNARWGEGADAILLALDALNPADATGRRPTAIKTIQFIDDDPTGLMQAIAAAHGNTPGNPASSYSRRNVEDLRQGRLADDRRSLEAAVDPGADRAALLLGELSRRRIDLRVIFGIADPSDVAEVRRVTGLALEMLGGVSSDDDLARLTLGRALVLRAATEMGDRGPLLDRALEVLDTGEGAPSEVVSTAAMALALRRSPGDPDRAEALARRVLELDPGTLSALEARLAAIAAVADDEQRVAPWVAGLNESATSPPLFMSGRLDGGLLLLALDAAARARLGVGSGPARIASALALHLDWWSSPRPGLAGEAVLSSGGRLVPPDAPLDEVSPTVALARGLALLPTPGQAVPTECLRALDTAARRAALGAGMTGAPGEASRVAEIASIRTAMAVSLWASSASSAEDQQRDAVARLDRCLAEFPGRAWRRDAAMHLLAHTGALLSAHPDDDTLAAPRVRALEVLVVESPRPDASGDASADAWRLELAQRLADLARGDEAREDRALALLDGAWQTRPAEAIDRLRAWVHARRVARHMGALVGALRAGDERVVRESARRAVASARAGIEPASRVEPGAADVLRADMAEALIALESPEASEVYADLRRRGVVLGGSRDAATLGLARALRAQGDEAGAFGVLRDLTATMPEPGDDPAGQETFWHAWAIMLEILGERWAERSDESARRTGIAHLLRLHAVDPDLGGEAWRRRLEATALLLGVALPAAAPSDGAVHSSP